MIVFKKGIFSVVSSLLLIAITIIVGVVTFNFTSSYLIDSQNSILSTSTIGDVNIQALSGESIYFSTKKDLNLTLLRVFDRRSGEEICSFQGSANVSNDGLVGWWTFDEGNGNVTYDKSGYGNHGELKSKIVFNITSIDGNNMTTNIALGKSDLLNNCLFGTNNVILDHIKYSTYNHTIILNNTSNISVGLNNITCGGPPIFKNYTSYNTIKFDGKDDYVEISTNEFDSEKGTISFFVNIHNKNNDNNPEYFIGHTTTSDTSFANRIQLYLENNYLNLGLGDNHFLATNLYFLNINKWYLISLSWEKSNYSVFINNDLIKNGTYNNFSSFGTHMDLGNNANRYVLPQVFSGEMNYVRIYNRTLSEEEIKQLYWYSIKNQREGSNQIDLSSCNLNDGSRYEIEMITEDGQRISKTMYNN